MEVGEATGDEVTFPILLRDYPATLTQFLFPFFFEKLLNWAFTYELLG